MMRPSQPRSRRMKAAQAVSGSRRATLLTADDLGASAMGARLAISGPFDLRREASARGIMGVDRLDCRVLEQPADAGVRLARLGENRVGHHAVLVEPAQRQHSLLENRRDPVDIFGCFLMCF